MTERREKTANEKGERPYEAPEVRTEEVFETLALTCTKTQQACATAPGTPTLES